MKRRIIVSLAAALFAGAVIAQVPPASPGLTRTDLQRHDLSIPGHEAIQTRVDFAPGAVSPWHSHPGEELIYVPEGALEIQLEGQAPVAIGVGGVFFVPAGAVHRVRNIGSAHSIELATYVVEKGKPLLARAAVAADR